METRANMLVVAKHCVICYVNRAAKFGSQVQFMLTFFSLSISFLPSQHYIQIPSNLQIPSNSCCMASLGPRRYSLGLDLGISHIKHARHMSQQLLG